MLCTTTYITQALLNYYNKWKDIVHGLGMFENLNFTAEIE